MDVEQVYKNLKAEHEALVQKEQDLAAKIRDIKALREAVGNRRIAVDKLQEELKKLLA